MVTEAKRRANDKWDAKNTHFFGVKMPNREADALKTLCKVEGITPHAFFLRAARAAIQEAGLSRPDGDADAEPDKPSTATSSSGSTPDGDTE